jgi:hypothetical protein
VSVSRVIIGGCGAATGTFSVVISGIGTSVENATRGADSGGSELCNTVGVCKPWRCLPDSACPGEGSGEDIDETLDLMVQIEGPSSLSLLRTIF